MVKETPIICTAESVRGILDDKKTETRRVIKPQPGRNIIQTAAVTWRYSDREGIDARSPTWRCPYGSPGDLLWVRETWAHYHDITRIVRPDGASYAEVSDGLAGYRADGFDSIEDFKEHIKWEIGRACEGVETKSDRWQSPIHMPRWASRITLKVMDVRVKRVQEIDTWGIECEGYPDVGYVPLARRDWFIDLWDSINAKRGFSWRSNPWVWVIKFEREGRKNVES